MLRFVLCIGDKCSGHCFRKVPSKAVCALCFKAWEPEPALAVAAADGGPPAEVGGFVPVISRRLPRPDAVIKFGA